MKYLEINLMLLRNMCNLNDSLSSIHLVLFNVFLYLNGLQNYKVIALPTRVAFTKLLLANDIRYNTEKPRYNFLSIQQ